jgi:hypothetical protein
MTNPTRHELLGYLLDALEPDERELVDDQLGRDPALQEELRLLRSGLELLGDEELHCEPPPGLAMRTCEFVARQSEVTSHDEMANHKEAAIARDLLPVSRSSWEKKGVHEPLSPRGRHARFVDLAVAVAICIVGVALVFPMIHATRVNAQVAACANKLREIGVALIRYSDRHNGSFPQVAESGNLAASGVYAPILIDGGYLTDPRTVICPASTMADDVKFRIPTLDELRTAQGKDLAELQRCMGGSYGYALGYRENGKYKATRNLYRDSFALASDVPAEDCSPSPNHGRGGYNVLLEDGHIVFLRTSRLEGSNDDIFTNDLGLVAAGCHVNDAVVVRSDVAP